MGITGIHAIPMMITCLLQGTLCDTGIPALFMGKNLQCCFRTSFSCFGTSLSCFRTSLFLFCNVLSLFFVFFQESDSVPGRPGIEEFVPGQEQEPLSRDKGTPGQENFFVPGQRDNGTSRHGLSRDVPSCGNANRNSVTQQHFLILKMFKTCQNWQYF